MPFDQLSVLTVSAKTLHIWFELSPPRNADATERLRAEVEQRADRTRLILSDEHGLAIAGCVVERNPPGAITWTPRVRADLSKACQQRALAQLATYIVKMCAHEGLRYLECTLKSNGDTERAWRAAMLAAGFEFVAKKCRYTRALAPDSHFKVSDLTPGLAVTDPTDPRVERLYEATLGGSADRSARFEARHGSGLGLTDLVFFAERDGSPVGLCALEHQAGAKRGWIKYVGTTPLSRRTGIATVLVAAALTRLATSGAEAADCLINEENYASIALHASLGFLPTSECGDSYYASLAPVTNDRTSLPALAPKAS